MSAPFNISGAPMDCPEDLLTTAEHVLSAMVLMFDDRNPGGDMSAASCMGIVHLLDGTMETIKSARELVATERREAFENGYRKGSELRLPKEPKSGPMAVAIAHGRDQVLDLLTGLDPMMAVRVRELLFGQAKEG